MINMMDGLSGWWLIGLGMMVLFWVTIILLVIWAVRSLFPRERRSERNQALETPQRLSRCESGLGRQSTISRPDSAFRKAGRSNDKSSIKKEREQCVIEQAF